MLFLKFEDQSVSCETYGTPLMFRVFFVLVCLLLISSFHKKSKSIGFQLKLKHKEKKF